MPGILRQSVDAAGGTNTVGSPNVFVNSKPTVRIGDALEPHGRGSHRSATMAVGSETVFANNIPVSRAGDPATCGHKAGPGSGNVFANS